MNYSLDPYAPSMASNVNDAMVASYPGTVQGFLKLQSHADLYPNYTAVLQKFLTVYGNASAVYIPDVVPPQLIDPREQQPGLGGVTPVPVQQQQQQTPPQVIGTQQQQTPPQVIGTQQQQTPPQVIGTQQQVVTQGQTQQQIQQQIQQMQQQAQQAPGNAMNIGKLLGLGAVAYVLYTLIKKR